MNLLSYLYNIQNAEISQEIISKFISYIVLLVTIHSRFLFYLRKFIYFKNFEVSRSFEAKRGQETDKIWKNI